MKLYLDMDGVLANFGKGLEEYPQLNQPWIEVPGFFRTLEPINEPKEELRELAKKHEIFILTKVETRDTMNRAYDKIEWVKEHLPFIKEENIIIVPYHERKIDYIQGFGVLVDDYKENLNEWIDNRIGMAVKFGKVFKENRPYPQITNLKQLEAIL